MRLGRKWGGMGGEGGQEEEGEKLKRAAGARDLKLGHAEGVYRMCQAREGCSGGGFPIGKSLLGGHYFQNFRACGAPFNRKTQLTIVRPMGTSLQDGLQDGICGPVSID